MNNLHYYSKNVGDLESKPAKFTYHIFEQTFTFNTDLGVFSKDYIDFGTQVMLKAFKPIESEFPILDMGSGYGPIGIIVSKLYNKQVIMCEINERAYNLSLKNIKENNADVIAYNSDLYEKISDSTFSQIITNPPIRAGKDIVFKIYDGAYERLIDNGELWVVIQKKQGMDSSKKHLLELFNNCQIIKKDKGYYILKSIKMPS